MGKYLIGVEYDAEFIDVLETDNLDEAISYCEKKNADLKNSVKFIPLAKDLDRVEQWAVLERTITHKPVYGGGFLCPNYEYAD